MNFVGLLEADLQDAGEYKVGGIGPLFKETRAEEMLSLCELLTRVVEALKKMGVTSVVSLFLGDQEAYTDAGDEQDNIDAALSAAGKSSAAETAISFTAMLTHEDGDLWHVLTIEGSVDHPADEAALSILDMARFLDEDDEGEEDEDEEGEAEDGGADIPSDELPDIKLDERDGEPLVEAFLLRLQGELDKELSLADPELDVWTDWSGQYDPDLHYSSALPGVSGIGS